MNLSARTYVALALVLLVGVMETWSADSLGLWRTGAALLVLGLAYEWLRTRLVPIRAAREDHSPLRLGREETITLTLEAGGYRPLPVQFVVQLPPGLDTAGTVRTCQLEPGAPHRERVAVVARELVTDADVLASWTSLAARVRGPLGLGWWNHPIPLDATLAVVPDLLGARGAAAGDARSGSKATLAGSGHELHHLREYVPGDPRQSIDWKAMARRGRPITRVQTEEQHVEVVLVLDVGRTSRTVVDTLSQFSHYVNLAARFAEMAANQGDHVGLVVAADRPQQAVAPHSGAQVVHRIRQALCASRPQPVETDLVAAASTAHRIARQRSLMVLLTDFYGQSTTGSLGACLRLWRARHLPMVVGLLGDDVQGLHSADAASLDEVYEQTAAEEYVQTLTHNADAAHRLGATTLLSRPRDLQARVFDQYRLLKLQHRL